jgi:hypothetical protein
MFSPKTTTPKELANFSVPRLRGSTPKRPLAFLSNSGSTLLSPAPNQTKTKQPFEEVDNNIADLPTNIVLSSPVNESPSARKWGVSLHSVPLSFDDEDTENSKRATKKKKTTQKKAKTTKTRKQ